MKKLVKLLTILTVTGAVMLPLSPIGTVGADIGLALHGYGVPMMGVPDLAGHLGAGHGLDRSDLTHMMADMSSTGLGFYSGYDL